MPSDINWPSPLPLPETTLAAEEAYSVVRTEMESGYVRQTRRWEGSRKTYSASWTFTQLQAYMFEVFWEDSLEGGTLFFNLPYASGPTETLETKTVRFVGGKFNKGYVPHMQWSIQATFEEEETISNNNPAIIAVYEMYGEDLDNFITDSDSLHELVNELFPVDLT